MRQQPRQARSAITVQTIIDAAERVFADMGYERTTTNHIAAEAHVPIGTLYRWFADKETIAGLLVDRYVERLSGVVTSAFGDHASDETPDLVRSIVGEIIGAWLAQPALPALANAAMGPVPISEAADRLHLLLTEQTATLLDLRVPGLDPNERDAVARTCIALLYGILHAAGTDPEHRDEFASEGSYAIAAYLAMKYPLASSARWSDPKTGVPPSRPSVF